jgi:Zn-dependent peptidase ImmA (M78 family)
MMSLTHIRALAEEYATKYNPEQLAPFPYENILREHKDLRIYFTSLDDDNVSGTILLKDGECNILINSNKPPTRQHFTLGHELGHYFLHQNLLQSEQGIIDGDDSLDGSKILYRSDDEAEKKKDIEIAANNFAASLLMPADLVRQAWEVTHSVEECARIFQVSVVAMSIRVTRMGLIAE